MDASRRSGGRWWEVFSDGTVQLRVHIVDDVGAAPERLARSAVHQSGQPHLGQRLRDLRRAAGLTLRQLEAQTGVGRSRLSQLETSPAPNPSLAVLLALQRAFGLDTIESLLGVLPSENAAPAYERLRDGTAQAG